MNFKQKGSSPVKREGTMKEPTLLGFLKAWLEFAEKADTLEEVQGFSKKLALCASVWDYVFKFQVENYPRVGKNTLIAVPDYRNARHEYVQDIRRQLKEMFRKEFPDCESNGAYYPFNEDGVDFCIEEIERTVHKNEKRLAWVRKTIKELEK